MKVYRSAPDDYCDEYNDANIDPIPRTVYTWIRGILILDPCIEKYDTMPYDDATLPWSRALTQQKLKPNHHQDIQCLALICHLTPRGHMSPGPRPRLYPYLESGHLGFLHIIEAKVVPILLLASVNCFFFV